MRPIVLAAAALILGSVAAFAQTRPPEGKSVLCAREGGVCRVQGIATVRYGTRDRFVERPVVDNAPCNSQFFGRDPAPGARKSCFFLVLGVGY